MPVHIGPPLPVAELDDAFAHRLGHLLWEVTALTRALTDAELAETLLTSRSLGMLDRIAVFPGTTVSEIARGAPRSQQAVSQLVARLEKLGYVERRLGSGRGVGLYLTESGAAVRDEGDRGERAAEERLRERLGTTDYDELRALLEHARDRLGNPTICHERPT
jgi:DNA-binding MarR family transcriptional regulator